MTSRSGSAYESFPSLSGGIGADGLGLRQFETSLDRLIVSGRQSQDRPETDSHGVTYSSRFQFFNSKRISTVNNEPSVNDIATREDSLVKAWRTVSEIDALLGSDFRPSMPTCDEDRPSVDDSYVKRLSTELEAALNLSLTFKERLRESLRTASSRRIVVGGPPGHFMGGPAGATATATATITPTTTTTTAGLVASAATSAASVSLSALSSSVTAPAATGAPGTSSISAPPAAPSAATSSAASSAAASTAASSLAATSSATSSVGGHASSASVSLAGAGGQDGTGPSWVSSGAGGAGGGGGEKAAPVGLGLPGAAGVGGGEAGSLGGLGAAGGGGGPGRVSSAGAADPPLPSGRTFFLPPSSRHADGTGAGGPSPSPAPVQTGLPALHLLHHHSHSHSLSHSQSQSHSHSHSQPHSHTHSPLISPRLSAASGGLGSTLSAVSAVSGTGTVSSFAAGGGGGGLPPASVSAGEAAASSAVAALTAALAGTGLGGGGGGTLGAVKGPGGHGVSTHGVQGVGQGALAGFTATGPAIAAASSGSTPSSGLYSSTGAGLAAGGGAPLSPRSVLQHPPPRSPRVSTTGLTSAAPAAAAAVGVAAGVVSGALAYSHPAAVATGPPANGLAAAPATAGLPSSSSAPSFQRPTSPQTLVSGAAFPSGSHPAPTAPASQQQQSQQQQQPQSQLQQCQQQLQQPPPPRRRLSGIRVAVGPALDHGVWDSDGGWRPAEQLHDVYVPPHLQRISPDDLVKVRELGRGCFGSVWLARWRGVEVALKELLNQAGATDGPPNEVFYEAERLASLRHPCVIAFYGIVPTPGSYATVVEYLRMGSLKSGLTRLRKQGADISKRLRVAIALQAARGMEYLHGQYVVHFDLKCDNLLCDLRDPGRPVVKIGDLGLSKKKKDSFVSGNMRGTLPWMAPELFPGVREKQRQEAAGAGGEAAPGAGAAAAAATGPGAAAAPASGVGRSSGSGAANGTELVDDRVNEKVDVFSFGIVLWEIWQLGEQPYSHVSLADIFAGVMTGSLRPGVPQDCDPDWAALMQTCWHAIPRARPSFSEIADRLDCLLERMTLAEAEAAKAAGAGTGTAPISFAAGSPRGLAAGGPGGVGLRY